MRLIDSDALYKKFTEIPWFDNADRDDVALEFVFEAPTVDATPVVHAHVVVNWLGDCHCSNCGESIDCTSNYCNWCGAILDEPEQSEA